MTTRELIQHLLLEKDLDKKVFVSCEGYSNFKYEDSPTMVYATDNGVIISDNGYCDDICSYTDFQKHFDEYEKNNIKITSTKEKKPMSVDDLKMLIDDSINDIFVEYFDRMDIKSGDIEPLQAFELDELEEQLTNFILKIAEQNMGVGN